MTCTKLEKNTPADEFTIISGTGSGTGRSFRKGVKTCIRKVGTISEIRSRFQKAGGAQSWICSGEDNLFNELARLLSTTPVKKSIGIYMLFEPSANRLPMLLHHFGVVAFGKCWLSDSELIEAILSDNRSELFIGGVVDDSAETITLWRIGLPPIIANFADFKPDGESVQPDFSRFSIEDGGQTIRLGDYEASSESILYEHDAAFRKTAKAKLIASDSTVNGSIRRLRKQRGLSRSAFSPISEKTIERIENHLTTKIHAGTLESIANTLGVSVADLSTY
jgi:hypothetical protein